MRPLCVVIDQVCVRFRFSRISVLIVNRNYWRPSLFAVLLFAVLTIHIKFMLSLTPVLSELAIRGSVIHIQIFLKRNPRE